VLRAGSRQVANVPDRDPTIAPGPPGPQGPEGPQGDTGPEGPQGEVGSLPDASDGGQLLRWNGGAWEPAQTYEVRRWLVGDLSPTDGRILEWDTSNPPGDWVFIDPPTGGDSLPDGTGAGEVLTWDGAAWGPDTLPPPGDTLPAGSEVGDVLTWDGAAWAADAPAAGAGGAPAFVGCSYYRTVTQGAGVIVWNVAAIDPDTLMNTSTGRFTPTVAGVYRIGVVLHTSTVGIGDIRIRKNGADVLLAQDLSGGGGSSIAAKQLSTLVALNGSTDYVDVLLSSWGLWCEGYATVNRFDAALVGTT
jgi:hypothetical protein